jgi:trehalose 6-phosphate synthase/phosphatase
VALYCVSDAALITPLRDGMNLVAKEYLACQQGESGVLILSEMAGAARELGEALMVNPNHKGEVAQAIHQALIMPREERIRRNQAMQERLRKHDSNHWAKAFQDALDELRDLQARLDARHLGAGQREALRDRYRNANSRLILLDYDGTLIPFAPHPRMAVPDASLLGILERLVQDGGNRVFLISGRSREVLEDWFGGIGLGLVAEHGVWIREQDGDWKLVKPLETGWKGKIRPILEAFVDRLPGSFLEEKDFSIAWHYRNADPELAAQRASELMDTLVHLTANLDIQVLEGKKIIEARCAGVNKGTAAAALRAVLDPGFILAVGDDSTDEDLFRALPQDADTIRVGMKSSFAQYNLRDPAEVRWLLEDLAAEDQPRLASGQGIQEGARAE